jgi:hypothetical protein
MLSVKKSPGVLTQLAVVLLAESHLQLLHSGEESLDASHLGEFLLHCLLNLQHHHHHHHHHLHHHHHHLHLHHL